MRKRVDFSGNLGTAAWRAGLIAIAATLAMPIAPSPASAQTIIDSANDCLARNRQAGDLGAAFGAIACFNRNMAAIAQRRDEIGAMVRVVEGCRGITEVRGEPEACRIRTVAGITNQQPAWVHFDGQCHKQWNAFASDTGRMLGEGCALTRGGEARFDQDGQLIVQMSKPDDEFLYLVGEFVNHKFETEQAFDSFDRCFMTCGRRMAPDVFERYGIKGYRDISRRYSQLVRRYREDRLEQKFAELVKTCDAVVGRWWRRASGQEQERLECRAPARR